MISGPQSNSSPRQPINLFNAISSTAFIVGSLALLFFSLKAFIEIGESGPSTFLKHVASSIFGSQSATGGFLMIAWGMVIHYFIAFAITSFLFLVYPRAQYFAHKKIITGIIYGMISFSAIEMIILPLSDMAFRETYTLRDLTLQLLVHIGAIGIPISIRAHYYYLHRKHKKQLQESAAGAHI